VHPYLMEGWRRTKPGYSGFIHGRKQGQELRSLCKPYADDHPDNPENKG